MTATAIEPLRRTFRALWERAPLWRFSLLTAALLSLLFSLFPPWSNRAGSLPEVLGTNQSSYTPQHQAIDTGNVAVSQSRASPAAAISQNQNEPSTALTNVQPMPVSRSAQPAPRTANLSLAMPVNQSTGNSQDVDSALMGRTFSGSITSGGYNLPLPPGDWVSLANMSIKTPTATGTVFFLGQIKHKRLIAAVQAFAIKSKDSPGAGFPEAKACTENNPYRVFASTEEGVTPFDHEACWLIENYFTSPLQQWADRGVKMDPLTRAAAGDLSAKGISYPQDLMMVKFTRAEKWGLLEANYLFSPDAEGISSNMALSIRDSDWTAPNLAGHLEKHAYVAKLKKWGAEFWPRFKTAFEEGKGQPRIPVVDNVPNDSRKPEPPVSGLQGIPVSIGYTVEQVKAAYQTPIDPEPFNVPGKPGVTLLRLRSKGVGIFFDPTGKASHIRFDLPFQGSLMGVKIGDSQEAVTTRLGKPAKIISKPGSPDELIYFPDDRFSVALMMSPSGEVATMSMNK